MEPQRRSSPQSHEGHKEEEFNRRWTQMNADEAWRPIAVFVVRHEQRERSRGGVPVTLLCALRGFVVNSLSAFICVHLRLKSFFVSFVPLW
jgi:hypothetical protein